ncbi:MAG: TfoX/Sxy family protein [Nitrospirae bacterium]|nr:TfoX/Sxy family protein [Nitrospirota bacterium]
MKDDSFKEFTLDQLRDLDGVSCRAMFGGHGLYCNGAFFAIIFNGRLYFKTDTTTGKQYIEKGMKPFRPSANQKLKTYYEVPADILEDPELLTVWARKAIKCQSQKKPLGRDECYEEGSRLR